MKHILLFFIILLTGLGCKPVRNTNDSQLESLDELSGDNDLAKAEGCSGIHSKDSFVSSYPGLSDAYSQQIKATSAIRPEVEKTLSAVPNGLKAIFFGLGYELHFVKSLASSCKSGTAANTETGSVLKKQEFASCSRSVAVTESNGSRSEKLILFIQETPKNFKANLVLAMMGFISKKLGTMSITADGKVTSNGLINQDMTAFKKTFALQVLHEGFSSGKNSFELLEANMPNDKAFRLRSTKLDGGPNSRTAIFDKFLTSNPVAAEFLISDIFENGADSFYCTGKTKLSFAHKYPISFSQWEQDIHQDLIEGSSASLVSEEEGSAEVTEGFSLWGRRHRPLRRWQPVRNAFRARNNQMVRNYEQTGFRRPRLAGYRRAWDGSGQWHQPPRWGSGRRIGWRVRRQYR